MDGPRRGYLPAPVPRMGIQSEEHKMAPDVEDVVHHHRDRTRRGPQSHRPDPAAFRLARGLGYVTPLLHIPAPHGPLSGKWGGAELGGGPMEHTGNGVRQKRSGDPGTQEGYETQTDCYPP